MKKQLIDIEEFNDNEVRIELCGQGHYILKQDLNKWIKANSKKIALEMYRNMRMPPVSLTKTLAVLTIEA